MDERTAGVLRELHAHGVAHDAVRADRLERLRNLEPETASLLSLLVRWGGATSVLELGTSNGYSTLWLAVAARATGGRVVSVDLDASRSEQAAGNLRRAGLDGLVELRVQDAGQVLRESPDGAWDLVFLDAERPEYPGYWPDLRRVIRPGGLLVVDNVLSHAEQVAAFRRLVAGAADFSEAVVPTGAGALLAVRDPPAAAAG